MFCHIVFDTNLKRDTWYITTNALHDDAINLGIEFVERFHFLYILSLDLKIYGHVNNNSRSKKIIWKHATFV